MWQKRLALGSAVGLCLGLSIAASQAATAHKRRPHVRVLPGYCNGTAPCHFRKGRYRLGSKTVLPGLRLTLPRGWSSDENDGGELNFSPAGHPNDRLFVWTDLVAVKSTGPGHGTPLPNVGTTPTALLSWLTTNPDFMVVSPPKATKIARRIPATTLTMGVSASANFGDPECPSNPRCAAFFTKPGWWGSGFYAIGYPEEVQISLAVIQRGGKEHTLFVALDAMNDSDMAVLRTATHSVIASFSIPKTVNPG